jgi:hypothetical protein
MQYEKFDFGEALRQLKRGERVCRTGWNGKGMWLGIVRANCWRYDDGSGQGGPLFGLVCEIDKLPFIGMKTADNKFVPWLASQTDILSEDWEVVP